MRDPHAPAPEHEPADRSWKHPAYRDRSDDDELLSSEEALAVPDPSCVHPAEMMDDPVIGYREASRRFLHLLNKAMIHILEAADPKMAGWEVCYAIGLPVCEGMTMTDRAALLGIKKATLSKNARNFLRGSHLPPSEYMKSEESTKSYADARTAQLT